MKRVLHIMVAAAFICSAHVTFAQDTRIRFFGQPELNATKTSEKNVFKGIDGTGQYIIKKDTNYTKSNFNTGSFVLFVTSQLSERISVLSEVSFNNNATESKFEVQRLLVRYYVKDYFSVRAGKMFTPIGYWNNQFTLGLVLQPTIQRPLALRTDNDGGILQYHDTGIQFEGDNITKAGFFYKVLLANGVGYKGSNDKGDTHIATTVQVGAEPVEGLKIIASGMFDRIEKGKPNPFGTILEDGGQLQLLVASVAYMDASKKPEFIAEYTNQQNKFKNTGTSVTNTYYVYGGYKVTDKITPYAMFSGAQSGKSTTEPDSYFLDLPIRYNQLTVGGRYKFNSNFICKLEYEFTDAKIYYLDIESGGVKTDDGFTSFNKSHGLRMQLAFVF